MRTGWYCEEELQTDASGARYYPYGALNVLDIAPKRFTPHRIFVVPPATWQEGLTDQNYFELPATMQGNALSLAMPWGEEQIVFPIQEPIMFMPK